LSLAWSKDRNGKAVQEIVSLFKYGDERIRGFLTNIDKYTLL
jgi:LysR family transcriptional activator of the allD operon